MPQRFRPIEAALPLVVAAVLLSCSVMRGSTAFYWPLAAGAAVAANQALSIIVPGRMLQRSDAEAGLSPHLLSRALADSGTVLAALVPWNLMGIMAATAVGLPVREWAPYTLLALLLPAVSLAFTAFEERVADNPWLVASDEVSAAD